MTARYFPMSQDFNSDPEGWELTDRFGDRMLRVWFQILAIGDRNHGVIKGTPEQWAPVWAHQFYKSSRWHGRDSNNILNALHWMIEKNWLAQRTLRDLSDPLLTRLLPPSDPLLTRLLPPSDPLLVIVKYAKYHKTRAEHSPPPNPPNPPNHKNHKNDSYKKAQAPLVLPDWIPTVEWEEFRAHRKRKRAPLTDKIIERLIAVLTELRELGHEPAAVLTKAVDRNWTSFEVDWIHKNGASAPGQAEGQLSERTQRILKRGL